MDGDVNVGGGVNVGRDKPLPKRRQVKRTEQPGEKPPKDRPYHQRK